VDSLTLMPLSYPVVALLPSAGAVEASPLSPLVVALARLRQTEAPAERAEADEFVARMYAEAHRLMGFAAGGAGYDSLAALKAAGTASTVAPAITALAAEAQGSALLASGSVLLAALSPASTPAAAVTGALALAAAESMVAADGYTLTGAAEMRAVLAAAAAALGVDVTARAAVLTEASVAMAVWQAHLGAYKAHYTDVSNGVGTMRDAALDALRIVQVVALQQAAVAPALLERVGGDLAALPAYSSAAGAAALVRAQAVGTAEVLRAAGLSPNLGANRPFAGSASSSGALSGCAGTLGSRFYPDAGVLSTDAAGNFRVSGGDAPAHAVLKLRGGTCTDALSNAKVAYAHELPVPADASAVRISPLNNLMQGAMPTLLGKDPKKARALSLLSSGFLCGDSGLRRWVHARSAAGLHPLA